jgi:hypothetical protein
MQVAGEEEAGVLADREGLAALRVSERGPPWRSHVWARVVDEWSGDSDPTQHPR